MTDPTTYVAPITNMQHRFIRFIEGDGTETPGAAPAGTPAPPAAEQPPTPDPAPEVFDKSYVEKLRTESANYRTKARDAETAADTKIKAALKALGIDTGGDETDPVKVAEAAAATNAAQRDAALNTARNTAAELIIWRNAKDLGINPQAITDSVAFNKAIADLDPTDPTAFSEAVKSAATTAATNNPMLKQAPVAGTSGGDFTGGTGELHDIDTQIAAAVKAGDHTKAISLKRQKAYTL